MKTILSAIALATALTGGVAKGAQIRNIINNTTDRTTEVINAEHRLIEFLANKEKEREKKVIKDIAINVGSAMVLLGGGLVALRRRNKKEQDTSPVSCLVSDDGSFEDDESKHNSQEEVVPPMFSPEAYRLYNAIRTISSIHEVNVGGHIFSLTDIFIGDRKHLLGFVLLDGKYQARYFYYSASGGNWHCAPAFHGRSPSKGIIKNGNNSRNITMSYENGTIVHDDLAKIIDNLPVSSSQISIDILGTNASMVEKGKIQQDEYTQLNMTQEANRVLDELEQDGVFVTPLLSDSRPFAEIFKKENNNYNIGFIGFYQYMSDIPVPQEIINNLDYHSEGKKWKHGQLGVSVSSELYQSKFQGKNIIIEYAVGSDKPDSPWIENIYFQDATVSTWGFLREQINPGILRTKPIEYVSQCPKLIQENGVKYGDYIDIREYTQGNPLIEAYKNMQ